MAGSSTVPDTSAGITSVKVSEILAAIEEGKARSCEWQAGHLEILRIPKIQAVWRRRNNNQPYEILRHDGIPYTPHAPEENRKICERKAWKDFAGYVFSYGLSTYNAVRAEYYSHSPGVALDGVQRTTLCRFVEALAYVSSAVAEGRTVYPDHLQMISKVGIRLVDDVSDAGEQAAR